MKIIRIVDVSNQPVSARLGAADEAYYLADARGRFRRIRRVPGNGQYVPGPGEVLAWFRQLGVTHVDVSPGWHDTVKPGIRSLRAFARIYHRLSREAEA